LKIQWTNLKFENLYLMKYKFITVEGNIGAGKTSLAKLLGKHYNAKLILETFAENPFLPKFFEDAKRYAFSAELFFLADRYQQLQEQLKTFNLFNEKTISDYVFVKSLLYSKVNLTNDEFKLFQRIFQIMYPSLPEPDLLVYIHSSVKRIIENIKKRGRNFEQSVSENYLLKIQNAYFNYFKQKPNLKILVINADSIDFVNNAAHFAKIVELIEKDYKKGVNFLNI